ncbi:ABC transporter ATP-binding protein [soil metagenome]
MSESMAFHTSGLVHVYRVAGTDVAALRGVDLDVLPGQRVALLGASGSGKSTLLTIAAGIVRPSAGTTTVFGTNLGLATQSQLSRLRGGTIGLMLQGASTNLLLHESAIGNVDWALRGTSRGSREVGAHVLDTGGIAVDGTTVGRMTAAQQQIVALAVAMASRPKLLLADEPTSQLDDDSRDRLLDVLVETTDREGTAVLLVTHDQAVAERMQRTIHLRDGRIGSEGNATGRFAVIGTDGSIQLPEELRTQWEAGALVTVEPAENGELRIRRAQP